MVFFLVISCCKAVLLTTTFEIMKRQLYRGSTGPPCACPCHEIANHHLGVRISKQRPYSHTKRKIVCQALDRSFLTQLWWRPPQRWNSCCPSSDTTESTKRCVDEVSFLSDSDMTQGDWITRKERHQFRDVDPSLMGMDGMAQCLRHHYYVGSGEFVNLRIKRHSEAVKWSIYHVTKKLGTLSNYCWLFDEVSHHTCWQRWPEDTTLLETSK